MDYKELKNLREAYNSVYEATGRDEMIAANIARAKAAKTPSTPSTSSTSSTPTPSTSSTSSTPTPTPTSPTSSTPESNGGIVGKLRDIAGRIGGEIGAQQGRQRNGNILGIPERIGRNRGTKQGQQMYDKAAETIGSFLKQDYEPDVFDIILEYLISEGYADTNENALVIMANMSEDWRQTILEYGNGGGAAPNAPNIAVKVVDKLSDIYHKFAPKKPVKKQTPDGFKPHQKFN